MHENILKFERARYFKVTLFTLVVFILLYASQGTGQPANGGTWQGYVLGTSAAMLIVWLALLGKRKRNYRSRLGSVQGWTSAHVYLGGSLLLVATLHCAAQFGLNVHTLAYILMCLVIISGFVGVYFYMRYPALGSRNRVNHSRDELFVELSRLNDSIRALSKRCDVEVQGVVDSAIDRTNIGGGVFAQLLATDASQLLLRIDGNQQSTASKTIANINQTAVIAFIGKRIPSSRKKDEAAHLQDLLAWLCRRQTVLQKIRKDIQLLGWMQVWLYVHIPLTMALLVALTIHITSVFFYW